MVFSSLLFLFLFLPSVILVYYVAPKRFRNLILFLASLIFYAWGEPVYIVIMIFSSLVDYTCGIVIDSRREEKAIAKTMLLLSIFINLGLLGFFKYYRFLIGSINDLFGVSLRNFNVTMPIGISFYTFQTMSYTIDVYRGKFPAQKNIIDYGTYVSLFSQLVAGPIVLYDTIAYQLKNRKESLADFGQGLERFIIGLGKKVLIANNIGVLWNEIQSMPEELTIVTAWIGILSFAFQIYFDFSGYSDMAIGLGKIFGFDFPENFKYPYTSKSITDFWRRWHISLGTWFKDYVYIPLGGSRCTKPRFYRNLFIVWFLTGLWHGASWNFILWGLYFGIIILLEKTLLLKVLKRVPKALCHIYSLLLILVGWVLFYFESLPKGINYLKAMFGLSPIDFINSRCIYLLYNYAIILFIAALASTPIIHKFIYRLKIKWEGFYHFASISFITMIMFLSTAYLVDATYNPFLYFRF
ncbi:MBOAT family protein [Clostridium malenominatum]|uniref:MBOAT family protein n=1 Tax=Clostridium malenominatum TaxID=1539 RepID=A0ABN1ISL8_9CLOT